MKLSIGQTVFAIGFQYSDDLCNVYYTVETPTRKAVKRHYLALTVIEEKESKCEHTGKVHEEKGYILKDQFDRLWNHNYPTHDSSGRGVLFDRNTDAISGNKEAIENILTNEVCAARTIAGFLQTLTMELYNLEFTRDGKKVDTNKDLVSWMKQHRETVLEEVKQKLFVEVTSEPETDLSGKEILPEKFVRYTVSDQTFSGALKALTFLGMFGQMRFWPDIFLGKLDLNFACHAFYEVTGNHATSSADLRNPKVREYMDLILRNLRAQLQGMVDELPESKRVVPEDPYFKEKVYKKSVHHTDEAYEFRDMNKPSEFGTIAEICAKYGISKSEARRRKQEGTLHELNQ